MELLDYAPSTPEESIARLERYADGMETVPPAGFNINPWARGRYSELMDRTAVMDASGCGTAACAAGWLPVLIPEAFQYVKIDQSSDFVCNMIRLRGIPAEQNYLEMPGISKLVDANISDTQYVDAYQYLADYYKTKKDSAGRFAIDYAYLATNPFNGTHNFSIRYKM